jgi:hypothetical protein
MTRKNRRTRNKSIRKVERRVRSKRSNRKDKSGRKQRRTNRKQRRTNRKQRRTNRKQRRVKRELYGGAGEPPGGAEPPGAAAPVQAVQPAQSAEPAEPAGPKSEQQGDTNAPVASLMETFGPSPYQLSKEGIKGAEAVLDETTRLEEKEKKIVFDETTSFQKIEELITKMKEDTCTGNISADEPLKTYEEMKKYKNSMMRKLNDLNLRRNLRIDRDNYLKNIKQEYDDLRINVFKFLTSKITSKRGEFESIMDYYKDLKTNPNQPADWQPRECWECFKKIVAFATDPEFFSFEIERKKSGRMPFKINTTNLVDKLITYNGGDTNLRDELKTKVKGYDRKFKDLKNKITTSEENRERAGKNLESVKEFFEYLDEEIKDCLNKISQWMLKGIQQMNTPQAQAERLLSGVEGITPEAMKQIIDILSSLTPQIPVGDQPASEGLQVPQTPLPQRPQGPSVLEQGRQQPPENREPSPGDEGQVPQIWNLDSPPQSPGELPPILERRRNNPLIDPGPPEDQGYPEEAAAEEAAAITATAEAALGDPVQQVGLTPTPPLKPAPGKHRLAAGIARPVPKAGEEPALEVDLDPEQGPGTPAPAGDVDTPPPAPPPGISTTGPTEEPAKPSGTPDPESEVEPGKVGSEQDLGSPVSKKEQNVGLSLKKEEQQVDG